MVCQRNATSTPREICEALPLPWQLIYRENRIFPMPLWNINPENAAIVSLYGAFFIGSHPLWLLFVLFRSVERHF